MGQSTSKLRSVVTRQLLKAVAGAITGKSQGMVEADYNPNLGSFIVHRNILPSPFPITL